MKNYLIAALLLLFSFACKETRPKNTTPKLIEKDFPFVWEGANLYFLLTDRFNNGNPDNDINFNRTSKTGELRGFEGGDIAGITKKIDTGYFDDLGINVIWFTPVLEQIHGSVDEGTGNSYGYHGYWTKDWTNLDPNFGTKEDLKKLVEKAHSKGIRVVLDAVINHTGPVTEQDPVWPESWVRTEPVCDFKTFETTTTCTLVKNLPDIKTENNNSVSIPEQLANKWKIENRYEEEMAELEAFFIRTGYPKSPRFYIIKWLTDYISEFGIDGYRADTVKHTEETVWEEFKKECEFAFALWKENNPNKVLDQNNFFLFGEVYNWNISQAKDFDFGDKKVNFFNYGFDAMINFELKTDAHNDYEFIFSKYSEIINKHLNEKTVVNYLTSHDDGTPFDKERTKPFESGTILLLTPGISQIYYGDESSRSLIIKGTEGDATLRSNMNWNQINSDTQTKKVLIHWQKLGQFRRNHPAIGGGTHKMISETPYIFSRTLKTNKFEDQVVIGLDLPIGEKIVQIGSIFKDDTILIDRYSGMEITVKKGVVSLDSEQNIVLLEKK